MIAMLALSAFAEPPRAEVFVGFAENPYQRYGFATIQPALLRSNDASFVFRVTLNQLDYTFLDNGRMSTIQSPGVTIGPGFVYAPGDLALSAAIGFGVRHISERFANLPAYKLDLEASFAVDAFWRPQQRAELYGQFTFSAADRYLWARAGSMFSLLPLLRPTGPVSLWLGGEATSSGALYASRSLDLGPVASVPIRPLHAALSVRAGVTYQDMGAGFDRQGYMAGVGVYWSY